MKKQWIDCGQYDLCIMYFGVLSDKFDCTGCEKYRMHHLEELYL